MRLGTSRADRRRDTVIPKLSRDDCDWFQSVQQSLLRIRKLYVSEKTEVTRRSRGLHVYMTLSRDS